MAPTNNNLAGDGGRIALGPDWQVRPFDHLQWMLERRDVGQIKRDGARWKPRAYCRTRVGLETAVSRLRAEGVILDPAPLADLPAVFPDSPEKPEFDAPAMRCEREGAA